MPLTHSLGTCFPVLGIFAYVEDGAAGLAKGDEALQLSAVDCKAI